jgi:hypothetical protein
MNSQLLVILISIAFLIGAIVSCFFYWQLSLLFSVLAILNILAFAASDPRER